MSFVSRGWGGGGVRPLRRLMSFVSASGLSGSKETAQSQVLVGMGLLAGSTVFLLTKGFSLTGTAKVLVCASNPTNYSPSMKVNFQASACFEQSIPSPPRAKEEHRRSSKKPKEHGGDKKRRSYTPEDRNDRRGADNGHDESTISKIKMPAMLSEF